MPLDLSAELEIPEITVWAMSRDFAVGAFNSPVSDLPVENSLVETQYCFGLWETPCEVEVEGEGSAFLGPDIVQFYNPGDRVSIKVRPDVPRARRWTGVVLSEEWVQAILSEYGIRDLPASQAFPRSFLSPGLADLGALHAFFKQAEQGSSALQMEETLTLLIDRLWHSGRSEPRQPSRLSTRRQALARKADELLIHECLEEAVSLSGLARQLGVTGPHLARCYRAATGRTLHSRLTSLRIASAIRRLAEGAADLTDLALDLGYTSHSHFTAAFRQQVGMPPSAFRALCAD